MPESQEALSPGYWLSLSLRGKGGNLPPGKGSQTPPCPARHSPSPLLALPHT